MKLRQIGTLGVHMKVALTWFVRWVHRVGITNFLSCRGCSSLPSAKYYFPHRTLFNFESPSPSTLGRHSGSRAGSPVSGSADSH